MTTDTSTNSTSPIADMKDRYSVEDYVTVANRRGRVIGLVQISKVTPSRYSARAVALNAQHNLIVYSNRFFSRTTGQCIDTIGKGDYLTGQSRSESEAQAWLKAWADEQAAERRLEVQKEVELALQNYDAGVAFFGPTLDHRVVELRPEGADPIFQFTGTMEVSGRSKVVVLQWTRRVTNSSREEYSQVSVDFWRMEWDFRENRWSGPITWWEQEVSSEAISEAAEIRDQTIENFLYGTILGSAVRRCA